MSRAVKAVRYRSSRQFAYLDLGRTSASTLLVTGTVRSGTTWLAEQVLNHDNRYRMIFEPLNKWRSPVAIPGLTWAKYLAPDDDAVEWRAALEAVVTGRIRSAWTDRANERRISRRRIIKCVSATNLLPWFWQRHPDMRTIHIVRHPFAVADSVCRLIDKSEQSPWPRQVADVDDVLAHAGLLDGPLLSQRDSILDLRQQCNSSFTLMVLRWCLENVVALREQWRSPNHHVLHYEDLVRGPAAELRRLEHALGPGSVPDPSTLARPSRTDFHKRVGTTRSQPGHEQELIARWEASIPLAEQQLGLSILETFGLDHVYGADPLPKAAPVPP